MIKFKDKIIEEIIKTTIKGKNDCFISSGILFRDPGKFSTIKISRKNIQDVIPGPIRSISKFILNDLNSLNYKIGLIFFLLSSELVSMSLL